MNYHSINSLIVFNLCFITSLSVHAAIKYSFDILGGKIKSHLFTYLILPLFPQLREQFLVHLTRLGIPFPSLFTVFPPVHLAEVNGTKFAVSYGHFTIT